MISSFHSLTKISDTIQGFECKKENFLYCCSILQNKIESLSSTTAKKMMRISSGYKNLAF